MSLRRECVPRQLTHDGAANDRSRSVSNGVRGAATSKETKETAVHIRRKSQIACEFSAVQKNLI